MNVLRRLQPEPGKVQEEGRFHADLVWRSLRASTKGPMALDLLEKRPEGFLFHLLSFSLSPPLGNPPLPPTPSCIAVPPAFPSSAR